MKFSEVLEKLEKSSEFEKFKKENEDAYLCAGFFVLDFEAKNNIQQLDFFIPKQNKIITFMINGEIKSQIEEEEKEKRGKLKEINPNVEVELDDAVKLAEKEVDKKINKIIAILQYFENKQIWNLTCLTEGFGMFRIFIDSKKGNIIKKEKGSLFDFVKKQ